MAPVRSPVKALFQSRPFLEQHVRDQLAARENVCMMDVVGFAVGARGTTRITGVSSPTTHWRTAREALSATRLGDASGRGSRAPYGANSSRYGNARKPASKSISSTPRASIAALPNSPIGRRCSSFWKTSRRQTRGSHLPQLQGGDLDGHAGRLAATIHRTLTSLVSWHLLASLAQPDLDQRTET